MMAQMKRRPAAVFEPPRADFQILSRTVYGKPLVYLDSAASAQKPRQVLDARNGRVLLRYAKRRGFTGHAWANPTDLVPEGEKYVKPKVTRKPRPCEEPPAVSRPHVRRARLSIKVK